METLDALTDVASSGIKQGTQPKNVLSSTVLLGLYVSHKPRSQNAHPKLP